MHKKIFIFFIGLLFFSCAKNKESNEIAGYENTWWIDQEKPSISLAESIMYVNSFEGLRVRETPDLSGQKIGLLPYSTEVFVNKTENRNVTIDGIEDHWKFIKSRDLEGWVFGGYLVPDQAIFDNSLIGTWLIYESNGEAASSRVYGFYFYEDNKYGWGHIGSGEFQSGSYSFSNGEVRFYGGYTDFDGSKVSFDYKRAVNFLDEHHAVFIDSDGFTRKARRQKNTGE